MEKEVTYAIVGTDKETGIRKTILGGFRSKEAAMRRLDREKQDREMCRMFRYMKVAKENYKPRMEGSCGTII